MENNEGITTMTAGVSTNVGNNGNSDERQALSEENPGIIEELTPRVSDSFEGPTSSVSDYSETVGNESNEAEEAADALLNSAKEDGFEEALTLFADDKLEAKEGNKKDEQEVVEGDKNEGSKTSDDEIIDGEEVISLEEENDPLEKEIEDKAEVVEKKVDDFLEEAKKDPELLTPEARAAIAQEVLFDMLMLLAELEKQKKKKKKGGLWEFLFMMIGEMLQRIFDPEGTDKREKPVQQEEEPEKDYEGMLEVLAGMNKAA